MRKFPRATDRQDDHDMTTTMPTATWPPAGWTEEDVEQLSLAREHVHAANRILDELAPKIEASTDSTPGRDLDSGFSYLWIVVDSNDDGCRADLERTLDEVLYARGDQGAADWYYLIVVNHMAISEALAQISEEDGTWGLDPGNRIRAFLDHRDKVLALGQEGES